MSPLHLEPHKKMPAGSANTRQRCEMVELMLKGRDWAELNTIEIDRGGASYTIDTLRALHETGKYGELFLIMGTDMLMMLDYGWRDPDEICRMCTLAVVARGAVRGTGACGTARRAPANVLLFPCRAPFARLFSSRRRRGGVGKRGALVVG